MVLVKPLQHADMRQAQRTTPFEHQAYLLPRLLPAEGKGCKKKQ
jgi:hypothetical protein